MEFTPFQKEILEFLRGHNESTVDEIKLGTGIADTTVRQSLKLFIAKGEVLIDKKRQPYVYSLNTDSETFEWRRAVIEIKKILMSDEEAQHKILNGLQKAPRGKWPEYRRFHEQLVDALRELEMEGKLIDTLEIPSERKVPAKV